MARSSNTQFALLGMLSFEPQAAYDMKKKMKNNLLKKIFTL